MELQTNHRTRRRVRRGRSLFRPAFFTFILLAVISLSVIWYIFGMPNREQVEAFPDISYPLTDRGKVFPNQTAWVEQGKVYLSFDFVKENVDESLAWDEKSKTVIITTKDKTLTFVEDQLEAFVNAKPFSVQVPVKEEDGIRYLPIEPLENIYPIRAKYDDGSGVVKIERSGDAVQLGNVIGDGEFFLRTGPTLKAPYIDMLQAGETIEIYAEKNGWYYAQKENGLIGFLDKNQVQLGEIKQIIHNVEGKERVPWSPLGGKINLTWEHVVSKNPETAKIQTMPGLNVISPTWFELSNEAGDLASRADLSYVKWAHQKGYQVWALFSNGFNPDWTTAALANLQTRQKMIAQLLQYAEMYHLDGINIDFENVYLKDKQNLVQFVRELTPYLHEKNLVVSMDITIKSTSEQWSLFYDRARLAEVVDYMIVMTYDEHWASSPKAGSVASMPWVEQGMKGVLEEVPASKLLLGVPYYTRLWMEEKDANDQVKVTSKALSMMQAENWIKERGLQPKYDEASGQMYVEFKDEKVPAVTYKMWLEEKGSMQKRVELVKKYDLAGMASWRRGFEQPVIWDAIVDTMEKRP
ncbi:glycosyl hydrolase family 18 protein [Ammoniphilus resinae]|uniref:Spore germination protein YaaH n=1 Tax=Ammoniphilus resinae TaxID=861532 RepID=A0ABS4GJ33_9BACL|nr:glycosyl hydrolase family 18 protein [Ammoniphilus resinae]MBP1930260.1 spore germination protein YaaH [Ammoniphilus resinae]